MRSSQKCYATNALDKCCYVWFRGRSILRDTQELLKDQSTVAMRNECDVTLSQPFLRQEQRQDVVGSVA